MRTLLGIGLGIGLTLAAVRPAAAETDFERDLRLISEKSDRSELLNIERQRLMLEQQRRLDEIYARPSAPAPQPQSPRVVFVDRGVDCARLRAVAAPDPSLEDRTATAMLRAMFARRVAEERAAKAPTKANVEAEERANAEWLVATKTHVTAMARRELADELCPLATPAAAAPAPAAAQR